MRAVRLSLLMLGLMMCLLTGCFDSNNQHNFTDWTTTKEATCQEVGKEIRKCRDCDLVESREIPESAHKITGWIDVGGSKRHVIMMARWLKNVLHVM